MMRLADGKLPCSTAPNWKRRSLYGFFWSIFFLARAVLRPSSEVSWARTETPQGSPWGIPHIRGYRRGRRCLLGTHRSPGPALRRGNRPAPIPSARLKSKAFTATKRASGCECHAWREARRALSPQVTGMRPRGRYGCAGCRKSPTSTAVWARLTGFWIPSVGQGLRVLRLALRAVSRIVQRMACKRAARFPHK